MQETGLVLAGGGGKGIYQVGMLKSLAEAGLLDSVTAVAGTSIGSVNAAIFTEGIANYKKMNPEKEGIHDAVLSAVSKMEKVWDDIDSKVFFNIDYSQINAGDTHFSRNATSQLIDKYLDYGLFQCEDTLPTFCTTAACPPDVISSEQVTDQEMKLLLSASVDETYRDYRAEYMSLNNQDKERIKNIILATTSLPVIYAPVNIEGQLYLDGGVKDNVPIKPLYDMGIRRFIVIELSNERGFDESSFPDAEIIDIIPSHDLGSLLSGTMNFDKEDKSVKKEIGVRDGRRYIKTLFEKDEIYIKLEKELAMRDYENIIQMRDFNRKYSSLSKDVNSRFDYINNLEESLKKYE